MEPAADVKTKERKGKGKKENGSGKKETQQNCLLLPKLVTIHENVYLSLEVIF